MCSLVFYFCLKRSELFVTETESQIKYLILRTFIYLGKIATKFSLLVKIEYYI